MEIILRISGGVFSIVEEAYEKLGYDPMKKDENGGYGEFDPGNFDRGDTEDDDDSIDIDIDSLEKLTQYLGAFKDFGLYLYITHKSDEIKISYSMCNKKDGYGKSKVSSQIEINRDAVAGDLNERIKKGKNR